MKQKPIYQRNQDLRRVLEESLRQNIKNQFYAESRKSPTAIFRGSITFPLEKYIERIFAYMKCSTSCFIIAFILMDRLKKALPGFILTHKNVHKVLVTCVIVAAKGLDDTYYSQEYYAKVAGIKQKQLTQLELRLLKLIDYDSIVTEKSFHQEVHKMEEFQAWLNQLPPPQHSVPHQHPTHE